MKSLDLFSGYGGITLALQDYVKPIAYVEIEEYAQKIIAYRMADGSLPRATILGDVKNVRGSVGVCDIITGGFPCQDISVAGHGKGLAGERSGLFYEIIRLAREIRPAFVFLENVPAIRTRGLREVVRAFTEIGYDCRWTCLSASDVGANHKRERWFLLAYSSDSRHRLNVQQVGELGSETTSYIGSYGEVQSMAYANSSRLERQDSPQPKEWNDNSKPSRSGETVADSTSSFSTGLRSREETKHSEFRSTIKHIFRSEWWATEPDVGWLLSDAIASGLGEDINEMQLLFENCGKKKVWQETRGFDHFQKSKILQQRLHGAWNDKGKTISFCNSETTKKASEGILREVWKVANFIHPSYRSKLDEQFGIELNDALFFLSYAFASYSGGYCEKNPEAAMSYLSESLVQIKSLFDSSIAIQEAWRSVGCEWQKSLLLGQLFREPPIGRICQNIDFRTDRIKALGNGVVPLQVKTAFELLMGLK